MAVGGDLPKDLSGLVRFLEEEENKDDLARSQATPSDGRSMDILLKKLEGLGDAEDDEDEDTGKEVSTQKVPPSHLEHQKLVEKKVCFDHQGSLSDTEGMQGAKGRPIFHRGGVKVKHVVEIPPYRPSESQKSPRGPGTLHLKKLPDTHAEDVDAASKHSSDSSKSSERQGTTPTDRSAIKEIQELNDLVDKYQLINKQFYEQIKQLKVERSHAEERHASERQQMLFRIGSLQAALYRGSSHLHADHGPHFLGHGTMTHMESDDQEKGRMSTLPTTEESITVVAALEEELALARDQISKMESALSESQVRKQELESQVAVLQQRLDRLERHSSSAALRGTSPRRGPSGRRESVGPVTGLAGKNVDERTGRPRSCISKLRGPDSRRASLTTSATEVEELRARITSQEAMISKLQEEVKNAKDSEMVETCESTLKRRLQSSDGSLRHQNDYFALSQLQHQIEKMHKQLEEKDKIIGSIGMKCSRLVEASKENLPSSSASTPTKSRGGASHTNIVLLKAKLQEKDAEILRLKRMVITKSRLASGQKCVLTENKKAVADSIKSNSKLLDEVRSVRKELEEKNRELRILKENHESLQEKFKKIQSGKNILMKSPKGAKGPDLGGARVCNPNKYQDPLQERLDYALRENIELESQRQQQEGKIAKMQMQLDELCKEREAMLRSLAEKTEQQREYEDLLQRLSQSPPSPSSQHHYQIRLAQLETTLETRTKALHYLKQRLDRMYGAPEAVERLHEENQELQRQIDLLHHQLYH
ncbi:uncharacterized protein LOC143025300 [Oratosquilla oratoria]|uniref:uncharacterized protein LOC143025300 n=1 Tax=Oratosquilla oratoria TaxID=337810 RepID=UPI003F7610F6